MDRVKIDISSNNNCDIRIYNNNVPECKNNDIKYTEEPEEENYDDLLFEFIEILDKYNNIKNKFKRIYDKFTYLFEPFRNNIFNIDLLIEDLDNFNRYEFFTDNEYVKNYFDKINMINKIDSITIKKKHKFINDLELSFKIFLSLKNNIYLINKLILLIIRTDIIDNQKILIIFDDFISRYINFVKYKNVLFEPEEKIIDVDKYKTIILLIFIIFKKVIRTKIIYSKIEDFNTFEEFVTNNKFESIIINTMKYLTCDLIQ